MLRSTLALAAAVALAGCASIFNGQEQSVVFRSEPAGASITITNRAGEQIHAGTTPVTISLKRGAGYFKPEVYTIRLNKPGFTAKEVVVTGTMSGWYIGNILLGGLIGMLAVDPVTGGMYVFPDSVNTPLEAASSPKASLGNELRVVSLDALTAEQRSKARLIGTLQ